MISPLQIEFHNTPPLEPVESRIRQELAELEKFYNRLISCRVDVEAPKHERGGVSKVRIDFGLPVEDAKAWADLEGLTARQGADHMLVNAQRKDAAMAAHAAFNIARRRLKDLVAVPPKHT
jgi:hypothetical protein